MSPRLMSTAIRRTLAVVQLIAVLTIASYYGCHSSEHAGSQPPPTVIGLRTHTSGIPLDRNYVGGWWAPDGNFWGWYDVGSNDDFVWIVEVPGVYVVELDGVAAHCSEQPSKLVDTLTVVEGDTTWAYFNLVCDGIALPADRLLIETGLFCSIETRVWTVMGDGSQRTPLSYPVLPDPFGRVSSKFSLSPDGSHLAWTRRLLGSYCVVVGFEFLVADLSAGSTDTVFVSRWNFGSPVRTLSRPGWSPDGSRIAIGVGGPEGDSTGIFLYDVSQQEMTRIATSGSDPDWDPTGSRIAFERAGDLFIMNLDGTIILQLSDSEEHDNSPDWSPDGSQILFTRTDFGPGTGPGGPQDAICVVNSDGSHLRVLALATEEFTHDRYPAWAPNGEVIAFSSDRDHTRIGDSVFLMNIDGSRLTDLGDGKAPQWIGP